MPSSRLPRQLANLEAARYQFNTGDGAKVEKLLHSLDRLRILDPASLIRFHEALLFLRAFPQNAAVLITAELILNRFHEKVAVLRQSGANLDDFDTFEHSGISGTTMEDTLSLDVARWLFHHLPGAIEIAWDNYDPGRELGTTGPRFMPLLEDDAFVEADTPFRSWLETAAGTSHGAVWLIDRFDRLPLPPQQKSELYESLRIPLRWHLGNSQITRTRNWQSPRKIFYHHGPLISRSQVSLAAELARRPPTFAHLPLPEGQRIADLIREIMLVRYRELYGTTLADPRSVVRVNLEGEAQPAWGRGSAPSKRGKAPLPLAPKAYSTRGLEIYLWNLPPTRRLPLRAYVAGFTLKNGVPINYIEAIGLCEWMEVGFNTFYTFRGGEAGWIYAQVLRSLCAFMGSTVVSVYPYQLGHDNDEAIESGAFWFYRKLGFRPGRPELLKLAESEEKKIAADPGYRTPARILKRLASGHVFYELPGAEIGAWDTFSTRNIGLRVNERMGRNFAGDADRMRDRAHRELERRFGLRAGVVDKSWAPLEQVAFDNLALMLSLVPGLRSWSKQDKADLIQIIRAKSSPDEMLYLHLTQRHARLREALLRLGSL